jgi:hypothetical protein
MRLAKPRIVKVLDCSTGHVLKSDMDRLEQADCPIPVHNYPEGAWVYVHNSGEEEDDLPGFSEAFVNVYRTARECGCTWLRLDCDGEEYEELAEFDW